MYSLKPISIPEQNRLLEIDFYLFIMHLLTTYNRSAIIYDIIDTLANLFGCNITILRSLVNGINTNSSSIIPDKEEIGILFYKVKMPVRKIRAKTHIHPQTLYRYILKYKAEGQMEYGPRLDEEDYAQMIKFMQQIDKLITWR